jgi:extradiol dioxygenase family protein
VAVQLDHLLIAAHDKRESAYFFTELFGLDDPQPAGFFLAVHLGAHLTLDYAEPGVDFPGQHYAFLVGEDDFDVIFGRVQERGIPYWADPRQEHPGEINRNDGGRGVYFDDPAGHHLEIITRRYGSGPVD